MFEDHKSKENLLADPKISENNSADRKIEVLFGVIENFYF